MTLNQSLRTTTIAVLSLVVATILAVGLGVAAAGSGELTGDLGFTRALQRLDGQPFETLATIGNTIGSTAGGLVVISLMILVAALWRAGKDLVFLTAVLALRLLATQLKPLFESPRPTADLVEIHGTFHGSGFPSGHALTAMTMALGLSIIAWRWTRHRPVAILAVAVLMLLALLIGLARVWSGAHWPSDVLGGYCFGVIIVALAVLIRDRQRWLEQ
jgi:membrane-associated phospholipid phosphatase